MRAAEAREGAARAGGRCRRALAPWRRGFAPPCATPRSGCRTRTPTSWPRWPPDSPPSPYASPSYAPACAPAPPPPRTGRPPTFARRKPAGRGAFSVRARSRLVVATAARTPSPKPTRHHRAPRRALTLRASCACARRRAAPARGPSPPGTHSGRHRSATSQTEASDCGMNRCGPRTHTDLRARTNKRNLRGLRLRLQNPARAGGDPVLVPSLVWRVCFLSFFLLLSGAWLGMQVRQSARPLTWCCRCIR